MDTTSEARLIMHWVEVPDGRGGSRLSAQWVDPTVVVPHVEMAVTAHAA